MNFSDCDVERRINQPLLTSWHSQNMHIISIAATRKCIYTLRVGGFQHRPRVSRWFFLADLPI
jgi:hypothetical protein